MERGRGRQHAGAMCELRSNTIEATAAVRIPSKMPSSSTTTSAIAAAKKSIRLTRHMRMKAGTSTSPATAVSTTAASTAFGKFFKNPVRKSRHSAKVREANTVRAGCAPPPCRSRPIARALLRPDSHGRAQPRGWQRRGREAPGAGRAHSRA